jgi:hypothetical protein
MAQLDKQLASEKALMQEEYRLKQQYSSSSGGGGGGSGKTSFTTGKPTGTTTGKTAKTTQQSILDLGYGPINASYLNQLVASGAVEEYVQNGVTLFRKKNKTSNPLASYGNFTVSSNLFKKG